uniref:Uncharacterized protein n=1 Tax=Musa acuminata subsp. malaccensis TaxID=214687 RepID=A0A804IX44_MUSAM
MEHEGEHGGGGAEVDEGRDAELAGYVDQDGGKEVQDQGGHVGGRGEGRHGDPGARLVVLDVTGDEVVGAVGVGRKLHGRKLLEANVEAGGGGGAEFGGCACGRWSSEENGGRWSLSLSLYMLRCCVRV